MFLSPSNTIWCNTLALILVHPIACCLTTPGHYINVDLQLVEGNVQDSNHQALLNDSALTNNKRTYMGHYSL